MTVLTVVPNHVWLSGCLLTAFQTIIWYFLAIFATFAAKIGAGTGFATISRRHFRFLTRFQSAILSPLFNLTYNEKLEENSRFRFLRSPVPA